MKINRTNPFHYIYYFIILFSFLSGYLLSLFSKKQDKSVICTAPVINPYILSIFKHFEFTNNKTYYLCISYSEYKDFKSKKSNILFALNPIHWKKIFLANLIITSHSIIFHSFVNLFSNITTVFCGHGIRTAKYFDRFSNKELIEKHFKKFHYKFTEVWLHSKTEKNIYEDLDYKKENLQVVGYLIQDEIKSSKNRPRKEKKVLIATTSYEKDRYVNTEFNFDNEYFLEVLNEIALIKNYEIIIKPHWKTHIDNEVVRKISKHNRLKYLQTFNAEDYVDLLSSVDLLITDWSGIYVDFLMQKKPIIFLDKPRPSNIYEFTKVYNNDIIKRDKDVDQLKNTILNNKYLTNIHDLYNLIYAESNLDLKVIDKISDRLRTYKYLT